MCFKWSLRLSTSSILSFVDFLFLYSSYVPGSFATDNLMYTFQVVSEFPERLCYHNLSELLCIFMASSNWLTSLSLSLVHIETECICDILWNETENFWCWQFLVTWYCASNTWVTSLMLSSFGLWPPQELQLWQWWGALDQIVGVCLPHQLISAN